jgi:hypothetical protein
MDNGNSPAKQRFIYAAQNKTPRKPKLLGVKVMT